MSAGERALAWIVAHADSFAPAPDGPMPAQLVTLGELGLLVHLLARSGRHGGALDRCRAALRAAYDADAIRTAVAQDKNTALHAWLTVLLGLDDADADAQARRMLIAEPNAFAAERMPHRTLELCWLLGVRRWTSPFAPSIEDVYRTTFLGRPHAIESASPADAYAVTHTVAYATDFGARPFLMAEPAAVAADVRGLLSRALGWENYDLVAELLATLRWLGAPAADEDAAAWHQISRRQLPSGAVVGVPADADLLAALGVAEDASFFALLYHATLVTVLATL